MLDIHLTMCKTDQYLSLLTDKSGQIVNDSTLYLKGFVGNMRDVRNNVNTSSKTKKATLTYKEAVLKQNKIVEKIANGSEERPILNKREPHAMFIN